MANGYREPGHARCQLPQVQTQSRGARADPRIVRPLRRSRRRAVHPVGPHGASAQAAREPDHSQGDERPSRGLAFRVCDGAPGRPRPGHGGRYVRPDRGPRRRRRGGLPAANLACQALAISAREPLRATHALAGRRRRVDHALRPGRYGFQRATQENSRPA